jgi:hypothetical protein
MMASKFTDAQKAFVIKQGEEGIPADELVMRVTIEQSSAVGLDLAKSVVQAQGVSARGEAVLRRRVTRSQLLKVF